ncbi:hypothetical protein AMAG_18345 [Allomyces macrogynus ATCC 38327]|uniref:Uncharacterized protein n=1 Tax=Allomyces macrogynus (strain ATCC 38327) TaxID=578462 RepID=A0A0L0S5T9_ALLM3|nr:hypothetical protein AMAG_18345 [Allomyces macrogynus ATCC 38327]|eukprot:KNE57781.1 hypothetical protein AMAG_18345 [Allomyces macrogynus ATCC 38327]
MMVNTCSAALGATNFPQQLWAIPAKSRPARPPAPMSDISSAIYSRSANIYAQVAGNALDPAARTCAPWHAIIQDKPVGPACIFVAARSLVLAPLVSDSGSLVLIRMVPCHVVDVVD